MSETEETAVPLRSPSSTRLSRPWRRKSALPPRWLFVPLSAPLFSQTLSPSLRRSSLSKGCGTHSTPPLTMLRDSRRSRSAAPRVSPDGKGRPRTALFPLSTPVGLHPTTPRADSLRRSE